jgi:hypothetical protein
MNGRRHLVILLAAVLSMAACAGSMATPAPTPTVAPTAGPTPAPTAWPTTTPARTPTIAPTLANNPAPSDLPFTIDCSALPSARHGDCEAYLVATRDRVYPILREMTGVSLSQCYRSIRYVILPTDPASGVGGTSSGDTITYSARYSIDLAQRFDVHELLHSAGSCAGALDLHLFHGFFLNAAYDLLGAHDAGWFTDKGIADFRRQLERSIAASATAAGADLASLCRGILADQLALVYLDVGVNSFRPLFRSTIPPLKLLAEPSATMTAVWGKYARQVVALNETLRNELNYPLDVPSCGLSAA